MTSKCPLQVHNDFCDQVVIIIVEKDKTFLCPFKKPIKIHKGCWGHHGQKYFIYFQNTKGVISHWEA